MGRGWGCGKALPQQGFASRSGLSARSPHLPECRSQAIFHCVAGKKGAPPAAAPLYQPTTGWTPQASISGESAGILQGREAGWEHGWQAGRRCQLVMGSG